MQFVTRATPIGYINSKCHIKKLKSSRICLIGYLGFILLEWFLIAWEWTYTQTHKHTDVRMKTISRNQACLVYKYEENLRNLSWELLK